MTDEVSTPDNLKKKQFSYPHGERRGGGELICEYIYDAADGEPDGKVERRHLPDGGRNFPQSTWVDDRRWPATCYMHTRQCTSP
jgi:hypothetical protein